MPVQVPGYQVHRRIGGGGVGDVFHAVRVAPGGFRKPVALKRLKLDHAIDARMVQRFFAEARISAQLEHPNVVRVHDLLVVDDGYFIVMELLRGHTMAALDGDRPWWLAFAIAEQALAGLEYAHALADEHGRRLGLVHRDLTPRNVFVCDTGVVKILDFGIAKLRAALSQAFTRDGVPMGTLEFLAPEQARGEAADPRVDLYQLAGSIYWMLTGEYPHGTGTPAELVARAMTGTLRPVRELRADVPEPAAAALMRALSPRAEDRPADAAAMRAELREALREVPDWSPAAIAKLLPASPALEEVDAPDSEPVRSAELAIAEPRVPVSPLAPTQVQAPPAPRRGLLLTGAGLAIGALAAFAIVRALDEPPPPREPPSYQRLTFRRGAVYTARFASGGEELVYSARWGEESTQTFRAAFDNPDALALGHSGADLLAVSRTGTLALIRDVSTYGYSRRGTLGEVALSGGAPRDLADDVEHADFSPDGESMAIVRWVADRPRLEYPMGTVLYESPAAGWIGEIRISPRGDRIAFVDHPMIGDDKGSLAIVDTAGVTAVLAGEYTSIRGIAWSPDGGEIFYTAAEGGPRSLFAVTPGGRVRSVERAPAQLTLLDVAPDGRLLIRQDVAELRTVGHPPDGAARDLSWLNFSFPASVSDDGQWVTMMESGSEVGAGPSVYLRRLDGSAPAVRITEAPGGIMSPDGRWVLGGRGATDQLHLIPTGAGEARLLLGPGLGDFVTGDWSRDGKRLFMFVARDKALHAYWYDLDAAQLHPVPRQDIRFAMRSHVLSPDGTRAVVIDENTDMLAIVTLADGVLVPVVGAQPGENFASWTDDGRALLVATMSTAPLVVTRLDPVSGERTPWRTLMPEDPVGVEQITAFEVTPDGRAFAYAYHRVLSTLYLVTGSTPSP